MVRVRGVVPQNFLQGVQHPLNFCVDLCHLWEALLCKKILCVPCVLWEDTVCFVGAAETAAPPELASVGGYFMNVGAWEVCQNSLILKNHKALTFTSQGFAMSKSCCTFRP